MTGQMQRRKGAKHATSSTFEADADWMLLSEPEYDAAQAVAESPPPPLAHMGGAVGAWLGLEAPDLEIESLDLPLRDSLSDDSLDDASAQGAVSSPHLHAGEETHLGKEERAPVASVGGNLDISPVPHVEWSLDSTPFPHITAVVPPLETCAAPTKRKHTEEATEPPCAEDQMSTSDPAAQRHVKQQRVARAELAGQPLRDSTSPPDDAPRSPSEQTGGSRDPPVHFETRVSSVRSEAPPPSRSAAVRASKQLSASSAAASPTAHRGTFAKRFFADLVAGRAEGYCESVSVVEDAAAGDKSWRPKHQLQNGWYLVCTPGASADAAAAGGLPPQLVDGLDGCSWSGQSGSEKRDEKAPELWLRDIGVNSPSGAMSSTAYSKRAKLFTYDPPSSAGAEKSSPETPGTSSHQAAECSVVHRGMKLLCVHDKRRYTKAPKKPASGGKGGGGGGGGKRGAKSKSK